MEVLVSGKDVKYLQIVCEWNAVDELTVEHFIFLLHACPLYKFYTS